MLNLRFLLALLLSYELQAVLIDCPHGRESMLAGQELVSGQICGHAANKLSANPELKALVVSPDGCCDQELVSHERIDPSQFKLSYYTSRYNPDNFY